MAQMSARRLSRLDGGMAERDLREEKSGYEAQIQWPTRGQRRLGRFKTPTRKGGVWGTRRFSELSRGQPPLDETKTAESSQLRVNICWLGLGG